MYPIICRNYRFRIALLAVIFLAAPLLTAAGAAPTGGADKTVLAFGNSRIYKDLAIAKNAAISESLLSAVQTTAARMLSKTELTENFETVTKVLTDNRDGFIQGYKILKEVRTDRYYRVLIQATVTTKEIRKKLADAGLQTGPDRLPSVLFMVAEKQINDIGYQYWWRSGGSFFQGETAISPMMDTLTEKGLTVIGTRQIQEQAGKASADKKLDATPANHEAAKLADKLGADLVVVGTASVESTANRMGENIRAYKGIVNVRVLEAETGEKLTTLRQQAVTGGEDPETASQNALSDAAYQAGRQLAGTIAALWQKAEQAKGRLTLTITGQNILPHLEQFRQAVRNTQGVTRLQTKEMTPDTATLAVQCKSSPQELADNLILQSYEQFGINITEVTAKGLKVELMPE